MRPGHDASFGPGPSEAVKGILGNHADFIAERFDANYPHLRGEFARVITHRTEHAPDLTDKFSTLYPLIEAYLARRCFGGPADLDDETVRTFLADPLEGDVAVARRLLRPVGGEHAQGALAHRPLRVSAARPGSRRAADSRFMRAPARPRSRRRP